MFNLSKRSVFFCHYLYNYLIIFSTHLHFAENFQRSHSFGIQAGLSEGGGRVLVTCSSAVIVLKSRPRARAIGELDKWPYLIGGRGSPLVLIIDAENQEVDIGEVVCWHSGGILDQSTINLSARSSSCPRTAAQASCYAGTPLMSDVSSR